MERFENISAEAFHGGSNHSSSWPTFDEISRPRSSLWILGSDFVNEFLDMLHQRGRENCCRICMNCCRKYVKFPYYFIFVYILHLLIFTSGPIKLTFCQQSSTRQLVQSFLLRCSKALPTLWPICRCSQTHSLQCPSWQIVWPCCNVWLPRETVRAV